MGNLRRATPSRRNSGARPRGQEMTCCVLGTDIGGEVKREIGGPGGGSSSQTEGFTFLLRPQEPGRGVAHGGTV